ncbi:MAG: hypothetical protein ACRD11_16145 [Terriglobia bacterium]
MISGSGFLPSTVALADGNPMVSHYFSPTQIAATLSGPTLAIATSVPITLSTPSPGGGTTAPVTLSLQPPPPSTLNVATFGATGSAFSTAGAIGAGSNQLVLSNAWDTTGTGEWVQVMHAGAPPTISQPDPPLVTPVSDTSGSGPTPYTGGTGACSYRVAALDGHGGETVAGPATSISNSAALGPTSFQNEIQWAGVQGAAGYAVYGSRGGAAWSLITVMELPQSAVFWTAGTAVSPGKRLVPLQPNGMLYSAAPIRFVVASGIAPGLVSVTPPSIEGIEDGQGFDVDWGTAEEERITVLSVDESSGSFSAVFQNNHPPGTRFFGLTGQTEPTWPTSLGSAVQDGAVTWRNIGLSVYDDGEPMVGSAGPTFDIPADVSLTPPDAALGDTLVAKVDDTSLTRNILYLAAAASSSVASASVMHDDGPAIEAALKDAAAATIAYQPYPDSQYVYSTPTVDFPSGQYDLDSALETNGLVSLSGQSGAILYITDPTQDILHLDTMGGFSLTITNLTFRGGRSSIWMGGPDVDGATVTLEGDTFLDTLGYAVYSAGLEVEGQRENDIHLSQTVKIDDSFAIACRAFLFTTSDMNTLDGDWVELSGSNGAVGTSAIVFYGQNLEISSGVFIPGSVPFKTRWVDDYGSNFESNGTRWSSETYGGIPVIFDYTNEYSSAEGGLGARNYDLGTAWDTVISISNGMLTGGGGTTFLGIVNCITACPAMLTIDDNFYTAYNSVMVAAPTGLNLNTFFTVSPVDVPGKFLTANQIRYSVDQNDDSSMYNSPSRPAIPWQLQPYTSTPVTAGKPLSGNWLTGQMATDLANPGVDWTVTETGKAAPLWRASAAVQRGTIAMPPEADATSVFIALSTGATGAKEPNFAACGTVGCEVSDGSVEWAWYGPAAHFSSGE